MSGAATYSGGKTGVTDMTVKFIANKIIVRNRFDKPIAGEIEAVISFLNETNNNEDNFNLKIKNNIEDIIKDPLFNLTPDELKKYEPEIINRCKFAFFETYVDFLEKNRDKLTPKQIDDLSLQLENLAINIKSTKGLWQESIKMLRKYQKLGKERLAKERKEASITEDLANTQPDDLSTNFSEGEQLGEQSNESQNLSNEDTDFGPVDVLDEV